MYTKQQAINLMNEWGGQQLPFFFMIDFELKRPVVYQLKDLPSTIAFDINGIKKNTPTAEPNKAFTFKANPIAFASYKKAFSQVKAELNYGNSYLLNLTMPTPITTNLNLKSIFCRSNAPYKLLLEHELVAFSPEPFIKIAGGKISSYPMKGTINAAIPEAKDILLNDEKEQAEHATIVDLIRNDLSKVATDVTLINYRYVEKVKTNNKTLLQVSSKIEGNMPVNYLDQLGDIIFALLPAGSISGAPKKKTIEIITKVEQTPRKYFTGIMGVFDGINIDSGVIIRYIEQINDKFVFRSGGGVTAQSNATSEYQEMLDKVYVSFN